MARQTTVIGIVVVLIVIGAILLLSNQFSVPPAQGVHTTQGQASGQTTAGSAGTVTAPVMFTDPAHVPAGTDALVVDYSSVSVHSSGSAGSGWVAASGSGSVNLLAVVNVSQVIGKANVSANSTINLVRLNVTSATITVNGTSYAVTLPNNNVTIAVTGQTKIGQSTGVLVDFAPTVTAVFNQNTTTFVMAPAARATVVANASAAAQANVGENVALSANAKAELSVATPNITISSASVEVNGTNTKVSVTVSDNSNSSVVLNSVVVRGNESVVASPSAGFNLSIGNGLTGGVGLGQTAKGSANAQYKALAAIGLNIVAFNTLGFVATSGGSLSVPNSAADIMTSGYVLAPGTSATLTFSGTVAYNSGTLYATPKAGSAYEVSVISQDGAEASTAVTAT